ncbi:MAG TPA: heavy-metal-associated domain-containing protein [bacterium]
MRRKVFKVPTIHCAGCVVSVKFIIRRVPSVQDVTGDLESKVVTIAFSEQTANEARFHEAVRQAGGHGVEV